MKSIVIFIATVIKVRKTESREVRKMDTYKARYSCLNAKSKDLRSFRLPVFSDFPSSRLFSTFAPYFDLYEHKENNERTERRG